jgi:flagellar motor switch protein FliM
MSGQVMTPDAIAALVDAAKEGRLPEEPTVDRSRQRRMRSMDFTRPTKFTADQERRLRRALETFCRTASTRLAAELRMSLELEVISVNQLTWSNAHAQVPPRSVACTVDVAPLGTRLLMSAEMNLILHAIEMLLGGSGGIVPRDRRLTDIDMALARHFLERVLGQMSIVWSDMWQLELSSGALDMHLDTAQTAPVSEPTLAFTIEARMDKESSTIGLLVPYASIAAVADQLGAGDDGRAEGDDHATDAVRSAVGRVEMTVRAEVAAIELPIEQVLALQPGDVLKLDTRAADGVTVYADSVPVHRGRPGRSGSRRAVQITERIEGADA